jgi:mono/diheme cytochrome c family protein
MLVGLVGRCSDADWPSTIDDSWWHHTHDADDADAGAGESELCQGPPGLYADNACHRLARGVVPYTPRYPLWSDGADKDRYLYLPEGAQIDTTNANRWAFPLGTRFYKTFSRDGRKLETRVFEKIKAEAGYDSWTAVSYAWTEKQRSAVVADAAGAKDVLGTKHDIPSQANCKSCHNQAGLDPINGFGALQLNHRGRGWTLQRLIDDGRLVNAGGDTPNVTVSAAALPGDETDRAALGYMHANCGNCHGGPMPRAGLDLSVPLGLSEVRDAPVLKSGSCACLQRWTGRTASDGSGYQFMYRVVPGSSAESAIAARMSLRGAGEQMPPLGTEHVDPEGLEAVSTWLDGLAPLDCEAQTVCPAPAAP